MTTKHNPFIFGRLEHEERTASGPRLFIPASVADWITPKSMLFEGPRGCGKSSTLKMLSWQLAWHETSLKTIYSPEVNPIFEKPQHLGVYCAVLEMDVDMWDRWKPNIVTKQRYFATYLEFLFLDLFLNAIDRIREKSDRLFRQADSEAAFVEKMVGYCWLTPSQRPRLLDHSFTCLRRAAEAVHNDLRLTVSSDASAKDVQGAFPAHSAGSLIKQFGAELLRSFPEAQKWSLFPMVDDCHLMTGWQAEVLNTAIARARTPIAYKVTSVSRLYDPRNTVMRRLICIEHDLSRIAMKPKRISKRYFEEYADLVNGVCKARIEDAYGPTAAAGFDLRAFLGHFDMERRLAEKLRTSEKPDSHELLARSRALAQKGKTPAVTAAWLNEMKVREPHTRMESALDRRRVDSSYLRKWSHVAGIALCKLNGIRLFPYSGLEVLLHLSYGSIRECLRMLHAMWEVAGLDIKGFVACKPFDYAKQTEAIAIASDASCRAVGDKSDSPLSKHVDLKGVVDRLGTLFDQCQSWPYVIAAPETASVCIKRRALEADRELFEAIQFGVLANAFVTQETTGDYLIGLHSVLAPHFRLCYRNPFYYPLRVSPGDLRTLFFSSDAASNEVVRGLLGSRLRSSKQRRRAERSNERRDGQMVLNLS